MPRLVPAIEHVWTVLDLIRWGTTYFTDRGIDSPRLTIELMLCHVLAIKRVQLYTDHERPLTANELALLKSFVLRRIQHEPLQYILGVTDFYGLALTVTPDVLIPRQETELLVDKVIRHLKSSDKAQGTTPCLDIGTGSGCIPIAVAVHVASTNWVAVDRSEGALAVARQNAERHAVSDRITCCALDVLDDVPDGTYAVITMNPPYIAAAEVGSLEPEVREHEPHMALTDDADGLRFFRRLASIASQIMQPDGVLLMEIGFGQSQEVQQIFAQSGYDIEIIDDLASIPRIARATIPRSVSTL